MSKLKTKKIDFKHNGLDKIFLIKTNMTDSQLKDAFESWSFRAKSATVDSFCAYVNNKNVGFECNKV